MVDIDIISREKLWLYRYLFEAKGCVYMDIYWEPKAVVIWIFIGSQRLCLYGYYLEPKAVFIWIFIWSQRLCLYGYYLEPKAVFIWILFGAQDSVYMDNI